MGKVTLDEDPMSKDEKQREFLDQVGSKRSGLVTEFIDFLKHNKKWWLAPIIIFMLLIAALAWVSGSGGAPFIYTLF